MSAADKFILLVDDSADDVLLFKRALTKARLKIQMHAVPCVDDAIQYLEGTGPYADQVVFPRPSVLMIDLHMPEKDGFHFLGWLGDHTEFQASRSLPSAA